MMLLLLLCLNFKKRYLRKELRCLFLFSVFFYDDDDDDDDSERISGGRGKEEEKGKGLKSKLSKQEKGTLGIKNDEHRVI